MVDVSTVRYRCLSLTSHGIHPVLQWCIRTYPTASRSSRPTCTRPQNPRTVPTPRIPELISLRRNLEAQSQLTVTSSIPLAATNPTPFLVSYRDVKCPLQTFSHIQNIPNRLYSPILRRSLLTRMIVTESHLTRRIQISSQPNQG